MFTIYKTPPTYGNSRTKWYTKIGHGTGTSDGGWSTCIIPPKQTWDGCTYCNCVGYAIGRYCEVQNNRKHFPTNPVGNAKGMPNYYRNLGYTVDTNVTVGSMICWSRNNEYGHVAFIERINSDGTFDFTEGNYGHESNYPFRYISNATTSRYTGYIGCIHPKDPVVGELPPVTTKTDGSYLTEKQMIDNAENFASFFKNRGWSLNAVCGLLGNMYAESAMNSGAEEVQGNINRGHGLIQWTPLSALTTQMNYMGLSGSWTNWLNQCEVIDAEHKGTSGSTTWYDVGYNMTALQFITSTQSPEYLAEVYCRNRERASTQRMCVRTSWARKFYDLLIGMWGTLGDYLGETSQSGSEMGVPLWIPKKRWYK